MPPTIVRLAEPSPRRCRTSCCPRRRTSCVHLRRACRGAADHPHASGRVCALIRPPVAPSADFSSTPPPLPSLPTGDALRLEIRLSNRARMALRCSSEYSIRHSARSSSLATLALPRARSSSSSATRRKSHGAGIHLQSYDWPWPFLPHSPRYQRRFAASTAHGGMSSSTARYASPRASTLVSFWRTAANTNIIWVTMTSVHFSASFGRTVQRSSICFL